MADGRQNNSGAPLFGEESVSRKSASHGEAGYARAARDFYPTEPWVTRALMAAVDFRLDRAAPKQNGLLGPVIWEPACGDGRMSTALDAEYHVYSSDIADYGFGEAGKDFLDRDSVAPEGLAAIVTNPPFDQARAFIVRALRLTEPMRGKVAILQRHEFDAPKGNRPLFKPPFAAKLILPRRPKWSDSDKASPRFPYAWYLWDWRHQGEPVIRWLDAAYDPARDSLESYNAAAEMGT